MGFCSSGVQIREESLDLRSVCGSLVGFDSAAVSWDYSTSRPRRYAGARK